MRRTCLPILLAVVAALRVVVRQQAGATNAFANRAINETLQARERPSIIDVWCPPNLGI